MSIPKPVQLNPLVSYPNEWTPVEYLCECGLNVRVGAKVVFGPFALSEYQHNCGKDGGHVMPGPIFASWEQRGEDWILTGRYI
jgi:hypothetical protein